MAINIAEYAPKFICGFPSAIAEVAAALRSLNRVPPPPIAVITTSETLYAHQRELLSSVFNCPVRMYYSSSEGAPFVIECPLGRLHVDITTGVIEWPDAGSDEIVVSSFIADLTPVVRYKIGDRMKRPRDGDESCPCGWQTPLVHSVEGRSQDFLEVPGRGKIFGAQFGDCLKGVNGVVQFQVTIADGVLVVYVQPDARSYDARASAQVESNLRKRVGGELPITIREVTEIPRALSGKLSVVG